MARGSKGGGSCEIKRADNMEKMMGRVHGSGDKKSANRPGERKIVMGK